MPRLVKGPDGNVQSFPDDATDAEISAALEAIPAANAKDVPKARTWTDTAVDALPAVGAIIGGLAGSVGSPVGSVVGAGAGGAAGAGVRARVNELRGVSEPDPLGTLSDMAKEGAIGAAVQVAPAAIGAAMRGSAPIVMRSAMGNSAATLAKKPDVAQIALDKGALVTRGGIHKLDEMLATRRGSAADRKAIKATREAIAERWKQLSSKDIESLFAMAGGRATPAVKSMLAQGLYHAAGMFSGVSPAILRGLVLAAQSPNDQP